MPIVQSLILLILLQAIRASVFFVIRMFYEPAVIYSDFVLIIIGAVLYVLNKPDAKKLGLSLTGRSRSVKRFYIISAMLMIFLFIISCVFFSENSIKNIIVNAKGVLLYPIFEELLFRGYLWNRLNKYSKSETQTFFIITVLFGLWHLGYWDVIGYHVSQNTVGVSMGRIMFYKVLVGLGFGLITGFARLKSKNTYSSILIHSCLNMFGR